MNLKKCTDPDCKKSNSKMPYTLKNKCPVCKEKTSEAHYKFIKIKGLLEKKKERN